jgi:hypothetical protein
MTEGHRMSFFRVEQIGHTYSSYSFSFRLFVTCFVHNLELPTSQRLPRTKATFPSCKRTDTLMASVSADRLRHEIQILLKDADLNTLSSKKVRQMLEEIFKCDFTDRKKQIDDILMSEITTRDIAPEPIPPVGIVRDNDQTSSQTFHSQSEVQANKQIDSRSDKEAPMEIHQQENQPDLRTTSTSSTTNRKPTTPSMKIERRRTCYNKELDISDQLAEIVGGHRVCDCFYCRLVKYLCLYLV